MKIYEPDDSLKTLYTSTKRKPFFVTVPRMNCIAFKGAGHPFQLACKTLFTLSYELKFGIARKTLDTDYAVSPMEVSWYLDKSTPQIAFSWTMMIVQPPFITAEHVRRAKMIAAEKGKRIDESRAEFSVIEGGRCVQAFHRGDYNRMNETLGTMIAFAQAHGLRHERYTHDVYLNDSRKTRTENLKTIMRLGVTGDCNRQTGGFCPREHEFA